MTMPADLPEIIHWLMDSGVVLHSLPRRPVESLGSSGNTNAAWVRHRIPLTSVAWECGGEWKPIKTLPRHWLPWLHRERSS